MRMSSYPDLERMAAEDLREVLLEREVLGASVRPSAGTEAVKALRRLCSEDRGTFPALTFGIPSCPAQS